MNTTDKKTTTQAVPKRTRVPITGHRQILEVKGKEPGFHYAWIDEGMVFVAQEAGFEHVRHPVQVGSERIDVSDITNGIITRNVGGGKFSHLMRIPQEWYDEDMANLDNRTNEQERARVRDNATDGLSGQIKVKTS